MYHGLNLIPYANSPNPLSHARARFVCIANLEISKIQNLHMSEEDDDDDMPSRHAALALLVPWPSSVSCIIFAWNESIRPCAALPQLTMALNHCQVKGIIHALRYRWD